MVRSAPSGEAESAAAANVRLSARIPPPSGAKFTALTTILVNDDGGPPQLAFAEIGEATEEATEIYEYSVLVTSLDEDVEAFGQLYRDRGDGENIFDEMKNQWGWGGYTTHDLARCRLAARLLALFYNWWNIFVRLADPSLHR